MTTQKLTRLTLKQGKKVNNKADERYIEEVLGGKPTRSKIKASNINPDPITFIQWGAVIFIIGVVLYAVLKVQPSAILYADTFFGIDAPLIEYFRIATGIMYGLTASIGFIFFKIMTEDEKVLERQEQNPLDLPYKRGNKWYIGNFWRIEVWSPRMFGVLTYLILIWQLLVAVEGIHDYTKPIEWFNAILPVLIEIGLATTVAKVLAQFRKWRNTITETLNLQKTAFQMAFEQRLQDERYLTILFQELREKLTSLRGNDWLKLASSEVTRKAITGEYERLTAGQQFALDVFAAKVKSAETTAEIIETQTAIEEATVDTTGLRVPPNGAVRWTPETLRNDFMMRTDLRSNMVYKQTDLDKDYANGYGVRVAFRGNKGTKDGARHYFTTR